MGIICHLDRRQLSKSSLGLLVLVEALIRCEGKVIR